MYIIRDGKGIIREWGTSEVVKFETEQEALEFIAGFFSSRMYPQLESDYLKELNN